MPDDLAFDAVQIQRLADAATAEINRLRSELRGAEARIAGLQATIRELRRGDAQKAWLSIPEQNTGTLADFIVALEPRLKAQLLARIAYQLEAT